MSRLRYLGVAALLAAAFFAGRLGRSFSPPVSSPPPQPVPPLLRARAVPGVVCPADSLGAEQVRDIVREELGRAAPPARQTTNPRPEPPPPTVEQVTASDQALTVVSEARQVGRWTAADREQLRRLLPQLDPRQREALQEELIPAINNQELRLDLPGPPL
jgi:hypothetical protein